MHGNSKFLTTVIKAKVIILNSHVTVTVAAEQKQPYGHHGVVNPTCEDYGIQERTNLSVKIFATTL